MGMTKETYIVVGVSLVFFCAVVYGVYYAYTSPTGLIARLNSDIHTLNEPEKAMYTTLTGEPTTIEAQGDEILIVNIWASWSPYSSTDFAVLSALKEKYGDRVRIVALNRMETGATAQAYLTSTGIHEGIEYLLDTTDYFFKTTDGYAMPETIIFDGIGNAVFHQRGAANESKLTNAIAEILNK